MAETAQERREREEKAFEKNIERFVYGEAPMPFSRYQIVGGRKVYKTFEDYLNG